MRKKICIIGASGLVGSNIANEALKKGYLVNGTVTKNVNDDEYKELFSLINSKNLKLFSANMDKIDTLDMPILGSEVVYISCLVPTYKSSKGIPAKELDLEEGYKEIILPTVKGCLNILKKCKDFNIKNIIICSSTSSVNPPEKNLIKNEIDHWSNEILQCNQKKFTSAAKTYMEKTAIEFCKLNNIRLSIVLPTGLYGNFILKKHINHNPFRWIKNAIEGGFPRHEVIPNDSISFIDLEDLSKIFLSCFENKNASGRYFGVYESLHWQDIYQHCKIMIPNMKFPKIYSGIKTKPTKFNFERRDSLGIKLKNFETTLSDSIKCVKKKFELS